MADVGFFESIARDLTGRGLLGGSVQLRLFAQPLVATLLGIRFGIRDAKRGKRPFLMSLVEAKTGRWPILRDALRNAVVPLCIGFILDAILQYMNLGRIRPAVAVVVGGLLVFLPFAIARSVTNRIWMHGHAGQLPHAP